MVFRCSSNYHSQLHKVNYLEADFPKSQRFDQSCWRMMKDKSLVSKWNTRQIAHKAVQSSTNGFFGHKYIYKKPPKSTGTMAQHKMQIFKVTMTVILESNKNTSQIITKYIVIIFITLICIEWFVRFSFPLEIFVLYHVRRQCTTNTKHYYHDIFDWKSEYYSSKSK